MADTTTTNYNFTKPEIGASKNSWGNKLNGNWDSVDSILKEKSDDLDALSTSLTEFKVEAGETFATKTELHRFVPVGTIFDGFWMVAPDGFVLLNGLTIGNQSSGASSRANTDCKALFTHLWNNLDQTSAPVRNSSGVVVARGASADADWAANRQITLPNQSDRVRVGNGSMSGAPVNIIPPEVGNSSILGRVFGVATHILTIGQMPRHGHPTRMSDFNDSTAQQHTSGGIMQNTRGNVDRPAYSGSPNASSGQQIGGAGNNEAHTNTQPSLVVNSIIKL